MKVLIFTADGFEDSELLVPMYRFLEMEAQVTVAGPDLETYTGKHGYEVEATRTFRDLRSEDYDVLIIPGGKAPETVRLDADALAVTREMMSAGKPVGAICHGPQVLISAGVLKGRKATSWQGIRDDVRIAGAEYINREVVVDDNLVTSRTPFDLPAFCRELTKLVHVGISV